MTRIPLLESKKGLIFAAISIGLLLVPLLENSHGETKPHLGWLDEMTQYYDLDLEAPLELCVSQSYSDTAAYAILDLTTGRQETINIIHFGVAESSWPLVFHQKSVLPEADRLRIVQLVKEIDRNGKAVLFYGDRRKGHGSSYPIRCALRQRLPDGTASASVHYYFLWDVDVLCTDIPQEKRAEWTNQRGKYVNCDVRWLGLKELLGIEMGHQPVKPGSEAKSAGEFLSRASESIDGDLHSHFIMPRKYVPVTGPFAGDIEPLLPFLYGRMMFQQETMATRMTARWLREGR